MKKKCICQFLLLKLCNVNESSFTRPTLLGELTVTCYELMPTVKKGFIDRTIKRRNRQTDKVGTERFESKIRDLEKRLNSLETSPRGKILLVNAEKS